MVQVIEQFSPGASIGRALGQGLGGGLEMLVKQKMEDIQQAKAQNKTQQQYAELIQKGFTPDEAALWLQFTEGGKTHLAKEIVERRQREKGLSSRGLAEEETPEGDFFGEARISETPQGEKFTLQEQDVGLTPKEKISREEARYKTNLPLFQKHQEKLKGYENEGLSIQQLQEFNATDKLPKGLQRWNVNLSTGELRIPFLANAETQAFVKTVNDFTTKAKDSFGARVTNFELNRFMKRLPTLLNTREGREIILRQMEIINQLNSMEAQATLDSFDKYGGVRKLDYDKAERLGRKQIKPLTEKLKKEYLSLASRGDKIESAAGTKLKKVKKGTAITEDIVDTLLQKTKGDVKAAKKLAQGLGYEF